MQLFTVTPSTNELSFTSPKLFDTRIPAWIRATTRFVESLFDARRGGFRSVPGGPVTLYGTCYALLTRFYLGIDDPPSDQIRRFILESQDPESGLMIGPELQNFLAPHGAMHDREHLLLHLTCASVPTCKHFGLKLPFPIKEACRFCEPEYLQAWLDRRNLKNAWFEGNNLLFVGQLLVCLRDEEYHPAAQHSLDAWFDWLDRHVDPATSLWGTNGYCSATEAVYGGYHQLLVYYHEKHPIQNPRGLVDTVLALQHLDGSFSPHGNGGACEDVDCVDILVNLYKRFDYRRAEIRCALRQCFRHILDLQNSDGGFPYNRNSRQSHMGIPGTDAPPNISTMFPTWFRVHTLALMAEILTDEPELQFPFRFTNNLSMGWHQAWNKTNHQLTLHDREAETKFEFCWRYRRVSFQVKASAKRTISRIRNVVRRIRRKVVGP